MFEHIKMQQLDDFFSALDERPAPGVFFYRINGYTDQIARFIQTYYEAARKAGVIIEGKIPNPDEKNLSYYNEIMGMDFQMDQGFVLQALKKWLPRMNDLQRRHVAASIYDSMNSLCKAGKNENMVKNAYIKFMCWLYYKFERVVHLLGNQQVPKILYEGTISSYELMMLQILSHAGCDVILLQYGGDQSYLRLDPESAQSDRLELPDMKEFPQTFHLRWIREQIQKEADQERLYGRRPQVQNCTNAWISGGGLSDIRQDPAARGTDPKLFYNCFIKIDGVEDKLAYTNELYQFHLKLQEQKRRVVIVDGGIPGPSMEEIGVIRRKNYGKPEQMIMDLSSNISYTASLELQRMMVKAFVDVMLLEAGQADGSLNRLTSQAVYLLCWLKRYQPELFSGWKLPDISCFIYMGGCNQDQDCLFLKFLARLPVDVLVLHPDLDTPCSLRDDLLYEIHYTESLQAVRFPKSGADVQMGTAAWHAERELDTLMYQDSGLYRNQQYAKANAVTLQTMYEEIPILWKEELKYRPNFSTINEIVSLPVIFAKVSGVKDGVVSTYWSQVKDLMTEDTFVIRSAPFLSATQPNPVKAHAAVFLKNGRLQREKIKSHPDYPYGFIREEMQEHMLDKLQLLIDQKIIRGTFENGTEYTIVSTILNLPKELVRLMQRFDFTKMNPKLVYINTGEKAISLEDTILTAYLNLTGFDVLFLVPTGYQCIEKYFLHRLPEEHQAGEYLYDLQAPALSGKQQAKRPKWRDIIFKRGT